MSSIKWSYSGLKDFTNCPRRFQEVKVLKRFEQKQTHQILYGLEVHQALENYVKDGKPLAKNYQRFQPLVDPLVEIDGTKYPEFKMALNVNKEPCKFTDTDYWVRGIVDLLIVSGDHAFIVDYKTGSNRYPDPKQLKLMALMTFAHFPEVNHIKAGLMFVMHNSFYPEEYSRDQIDSLWALFKDDLERLKYAYENDVWHESPTALCGWCPVTICKHHKER
jgi:CRISPR/Cas system-associated exonuclease Cas4 (RecB family)